MIINSKFLIFARHPESVKNVVGAFSSTSGIEQLTPTGDAQSIDILNGLLRFSIIAGVSKGDSVIVSSPCERAITLANRLANAMSSHVIVDDRIKPIDSGSVAGKTETQALVDTPGFMRMLELYRAGVTGSDHIHGYGESLKSFEARIASSITDILNLDKRLVAVIGHRSSITASLINLARRSLNYPPDFYGYIPLDLGYLTSIRVTDVNDLVWLAVNRPADEVCHRLASFLSGQAINALSAS